MGSVGILIVLLILLFFYGTDERSVSNLYIVPAGTFSLFHKTDISTEESLVPTTGLTTSDIYPPLKNARPNGRDNCSIQSVFQNLSCGNMSYDECPARPLPAVYENDGQHYEVACLRDFMGADRSRGNWCVGRPVVRPGLIHRLSPCSMQFLSGLGGTTVPIVLGQNINPNAPVTQLQVQIISNPSSVKLHTAN